MAKGLRNITLKIEKTYEEVFHLEVPNTLPDDEVFDYASDRDLLEDPVSDDEVILKVTVEDR